VAVIGAPGDDDGEADSGSAYVFEKPPGGWEDMTETAKLTAPDAPPNEYFGYSVSISGDVAVIGAFYHAGAGAAYVFRRDDDGTPSDPSDDSWVKEAILSASDAAEGDWFGYSVSISGDVAVIGAPWDDDGGADSSSAYVFEKPPGGWENMTETAKLTASDGATYDEFGCSVSISGDVVMIGAPGDDSLSGS